VPAADRSLPDIACRIVELEHRDRARVAEQLEYIAHHHLLPEGRFTVRRRQDGALAFADPPALAATG
jgi:hypothetical protein